MKSGFYYVNPERKNPIKMIKILFEYNFTIKRPKNTIIIKTQIFWIVGFLGPVDPVFTACVLPPRDPPETSQESLDSSELAELPKLLPEASQRRPPSQKIPADAR